MSAVELDRPVRLQQPSPAHRRWALLLMVLSAVTSAGLSPVYARCLGPEDRGAFAVILGVHAIMNPLVSFGIPLAVRSISFKDPGAAYSILRRHSIICLWMALAGVLGDVIWVASTRDDGFLNWSRWLLGFPLVVTPLVAARMSSSGYLLARGETLRLAFLTFSSSAVTGSVSVILSLMSYLTLETACMSFGLGMVVQYLIGEIWIRGSIRELDIPTPSRIPRPGVFWPIQILEFALARFDVVWLGASASMAVAGIYSVAAFPATFASVVASGVFANQMARKVGEGAGPRVRESSRTVLLMVAGGWAVFGFPYALLIPPIFGSSYGAAPIYIPLAALCSVAATASYLVVQVVAVDGDRQSRYLLVVGTILILLIGLVVDWFASSFAAVLSVASMLLILALGMILIPLSDSHSEDLLAVTAQG